MGYASTMNSDRSRPPRDDPDRAVEQRGAPPGEVPNEREAERTFRHTDADTLADATDLTDRDGEDVRRYTGEPVPTEHGQVIPQQSVAGREQVVGGGEWPDAPPRGDEEPGAETTSDTSPDAPTDDAPTAPDR